MSTEAFKIQVLERENSQLREQIAHLEACIVGAEAPYDLLGLTRHESRCLAAIIKAGILSKDRILAIVYSDRLDQDIPELKIVDVFVCKVRKKLKPFGVRIDTIWGQGYAVTAESRQRLADTVAQLGGDRRVA